MRCRALIASSVTALAAATFAASPTALADTASTPSQNQSCTPLPLAASTYIAADGSTLPDTAKDADRGAAANKRVYLLPDGMTTSMIIPPVGFNPATASPATAKAFGFDDQEKNYSGYRGTIASAPCASHVVHSVRELSTQGTDGPTHTVYGSSNWGGYVAKGYSNYNEVYDSQQIPTYLATCGSDYNTDTSPWIGLGGFYGSNDGLLQQGWDSGWEYGALNGAHFWYEYEKGNSNNGSIYIGSDQNAGDVISQYMTYSTANSGTTVFHWYNQTTGYRWPAQTVTGSAYFYTGNAADFITERPGGVQPLRQFTTQYFTGAGAFHGSTASNLFNLPYDYAKLTTDGTDSGAKLIYSTIETGSSSAFHQDFAQCQ
jgi:hypothetical protein